MTPFLWLDQKALDRVEQIVNENRPMTDEEIREITTAQLRNVLLYKRPRPEPPRPGRTRRLLLIGIPFLLVMGLAGYLVVTCYPRSVFLWGDEVDRYNAILQRRRVLWSVIVGIVIIGVLGKFLSEAFLSWIPN